MFQSFFVDKLQRDLALNLQWADFLETKEDELTDEIRLAASKMINSHHIWNCRLRRSEQESDLTDVMPQLHWKQLLQANSRETLMYLDDFSSEEKIRFHDSEGVQLEQLSVDLLFQLLQDNSFYRGQLVLLCSKQGWDFQLSLLSVWVGQVYWVFKFRKFLSLEINLETHQLKTLKHGTKMIRKAERKIEVFNAF